MNLLIASRGSTCLINIGSGSYNGINVSKSGAIMNENFIPKVYLKTLLSNAPIYIDNGGGFAAKAVILSQRADISSIEAVESLPSGYTEY